MMKNSKNPDLESRFFQEEFPALIQYISSNGVDSFDSIELSKMLNNQRQPRGSQPAVHRRWYAAHFVIVTEQLQLDYTGILGWLCVNFLDKITSESDNMVKGLHISYLFCSRDVMLLPWKTKLVNLNPSTIKESILFPSACQLQQQQKARRTQKSYFQRSC